MVAASFFAQRGRVRGAWLLVLVAFVLQAGYLAVAMLVATVAVYLPAALLVAVLDGGLLWLWGALALWMVARFVGMAGRFRTTRWEIAGATR